MMLRPRPLVKCSSGGCAGPSRSRRRAGAMLAGFARRGLRAKERSRPAAEAAARAARYLEATQVLKAISPTAASATATATAVSTPGTLPTAADIIGRSRCVWRQACVESTCVGRVRSSLTRIRLRLD